MTDPVDLQRFVEAQKSVYPTALAELRQGRKQTHWMWFVFPQVEGLGHSPMALHYAIRSRGEAEAYLAHRVLSVRLLESTVAVLSVPDKSAHEIFGSPDDMKFRSSMTLFATVGKDPLFAQALDRFYDGKRDLATLDILISWSG